MATATTLIDGLAGAIGSAFDADHNRLYFVEYGGKLSRYDLVRGFGGVVSSGSGTLRGTWLFDLDTGTEMAGEAPADIWWEQQTSVKRRMTPRHGARIVYLGKVSFHALSYADLQGLTYTTDPIHADDDSSNLLVPGAVFAVRTNDDAVAKVQVLQYGYNLKIRWRTYRLQDAYQVIGTGYDRPEDIALSADGVHAYVTERGGNLLRVPLATADRVHATVVASGLTAPHQIALDEPRANAYVVEFGTAGELVRVDLNSGATTAVYTGLERAIGLLISSDLQHAYVSQQAGGSGQLSRIDLAAGQRQLLADGLTAPFMLTWADASESAILTTERDPANRVTLIDLTGPSVTITHLGSGVPTRPSSVALVDPYRLLICADDELADLALAPSAYTAEGPTILGVGHVPFDRITGATPGEPVGYADTSGDPGYFFQVRHAPFGGTLSLMLNHDGAWADGARYYKLDVDGVEPRSSFTDYLWSASQKRFVSTTTSPSSGYYAVRKPSDLWYNHWLGYRLNTRAFDDGVRTITVRLYGAKNAASLMSTTTLSVRVDNHWPRASIDAILHHHHVHGPTMVGTCGIVDEPHNAFSFELTAADAEGHLKSWSLAALWGDNQSAGIASGSYAPPSGGGFGWVGLEHETVPATTPWAALETRCAHTFRLVVWDRVIDGYNHLHRSTYYKSITLMLP